MSVIIRLQNLPWTANARDIRNFFTGLSIPEGGVHIIGGEMGDAFIAFSTDEDARCAMLKDREKLMEVQVRLLLSSRAEMQKVIETARKVSAAAATVAAVTPAAATSSAQVVAALTMPPVPQPPVIGSIMGQVQQQQQQQVVPSFLAYQQQAGISLADVAGVKAERNSPELENFSSSRLRRHSRSRSHSRSTSSDDSDRSRDRDRDRHHNRDRDTRRDARGRKRRQDLRSDSSERDLKIQPTTMKPNIMPWATVAPATAATVASNTLSGVVPGLQQQLNLMSVLQSVPGLQSYNTTSSNSTTKNYNLNITAATQQQQQQPKQPLHLLSDLGAQVTPNSGQDQPIAFANVNPYAQMYPQLFQQQQQLLLQQQTAKTAGGMGNSPNPGGDVVSLGGGGGGSGGAAGVGSVGGVASSGSALPIAETCYIKISGMCPTTSYSDLRKYFAGLYIPHNGIKIVSGANGARTGVAYIEFSRVSSAQKALARNNTMFRNRFVQIVPISDEEFEQVDERVQRNNNRETEGGGGSRSSSGTPATAAPADAPAALPPISVLYVEDLPQLTTEQDIMKMFSATCTIVDILLTPSPHNRREFVAFVLFARENEARSALEDTARHYIGFRKLRVRASNQAEMQNAKEKMRRANEQLQKEEQQQREDAEREQQSKQQQQQQEQLLALQAKLSNDPRRRNNINNNNIDGQQQPNLHAHNNNNNSHNNMQPFVNTGMHNGNMPFAFQQQHNSSNNTGLNMHNNNNNNNNIMHMNNNSNNNNNGIHMINNNMPPFAMHNQQMQQQHHQQQQHPQHHQQLQPPRRQEDVFVRVHNCEYATRINDLGEFFSSENLRIEHIEMLFNERNQSAGEFIVEFVDVHNAKMAIMEFHNRRFRGRGLRLSPITPQEIADRMNKPFMDYLPGGNGPRQSDKAAHLPLQQQQQQQQQHQSRRRGPSRFDDASNRGMGQQQQQLPPTTQVQQSLPPPHDSDDSNSSKQQHFNPFAARPGAPDLNPDELPVIAPVMNNNISGVVGPSPDEGIPDKFNRPGCVVAMRNVPFKADLKDILRFFSDYKLSPDDILRRFNDEGKPTGDARVAFESQSEARSAFETRRRKQIFNRTVYLDII